MPLQSQAQDRIGEEENSIEKTYSLDWKIELKIDLFLFFLGMKQSGFTFNLKQELKKGEM